MIEHLDDCQCAGLVGGQSVSPFASSWLGSFGPPSSISITASPVVVAAPFLRSIKNSFNFLGNSDQSFAGSSVSVGDYYSLV